MARKPRSQWSPDYRRRVERAEALGLSRQAARGHRPREHVSRKAGRGLPGSQSAAIDKFARQQAKRAGGDQDQASAVLKAWVREHGFERFRELRATVQASEAQRRQRTTIHIERGGKRATLHISTGTADLQGDFDDFELPEMPEGEDLGWLYYH